MSLQKYLAAGLGPRVLTGIILLAVVFTAWKAGGFPFFCCFLPYAAQDNGNSTRFFSRTRNWPPSCSAFCSGRDSSPSAVFYRSTPPAWR